MPDDSTHVVGWDPSTAGAAWAELRVSSSQRRYIASGVCESEAAIHGVLRGLMPGTLIGIEMPQGIHTPKNDAKTARGRGVQLMKTRGSAAAIGSAARLLGFEVVEVTPAQCRRAIGARGSSSDAVVANAIRILVPNWPSKSNDHVRDAAACAIAAAMLSWVPRMQTHAAKPVAIR